VAWTGSCINVLVPLALTASQASRKNFFNCRSRGLSPFASRISRLVSMYTEVYPTDTRLLYCLNALDCRYYGRVCRGSACRLQVLQLAGNICKEHAFHRNRHASWTQTDDATCRRSKDSGVSQPVCPLEARRIKTLPHEQGLINIKLWLTSLAPSSLHLLSSCRLLVARTGTTLS
jgi:hypothetical protein